MPTSVRIAVSNISPLVGIVALVGVVPLAGAFVGNVFTRDVVILGEESLSRFVSEQGPLKTKPKDKI